MNDQDDYDAACWQQAEFDERRQREDELLARCRPLAEQAKRDSAQFERDCEAFRKRTLPPTQYQHWSPNGRKTIHRR